MRSLLKASSVILSLVFCVCDTTSAQCEGQYDWAVWEEFSGFTATGSITNGNGTFTVTMEANYWFDYTVNIYNYGAFNGFNGPLPPNATVPRTTWAAGQGGVTTMCFSETVTNPVLLLSSLGSPGIIVTLEFSVPYSVVFDGGGMTYPNNTTIIGQEGYAILVFPGDFDCVTIYSSTPENYTNLTWGLNPPHFEIEISGDTIACGSTTLTASGGVSYQWNGGNSPQSATNTFQQSGNYAVTATDANGCTAVANVNLTIHPEYDTEEVALLCEGESYDFNGLSLDQPGLYEMLLQTEEGCDSLVTLNLVVLPQSQEEWFEFICEGDGYPFNQTFLTEPGTYYANLENQFGCDSLITLHLQVHPSSWTELQASICPGQTYPFNGAELSTPGYYVASLPGQYGCDSTVALTLEELPAPVTNLSASICSGDSYFFNGNNLTVGGNYTATLPLPSGCDSLVILDLEVRPLSTTSLSAAICTGAFHVFQGDTLTQAGDYQVTLQNQAGCDSILQLALTVHPSGGSIQTQTICSGESYLFHGDTLTEPGIYAHPLTNQFGCDSTLSLTLNVLPVFLTEIQAQICAGQAYPFQGTSLTEGGIYTADLSSAQGCDSIVRLTLAVVSLIEAPLTVRICAGESYPFGGILLDTPGLYRDTLLSSGGCDSVSILNLLVEVPIQETIQAAICPGQSWPFNGQLLTESGTYSAALPSTSGCDSLVTLHLEVFDPISTTISTQICAGQVFPFQGQNLSEEGIYTATLPSWQGCDSTVILDLTVAAVLLSTRQDSICEGGVYVFGGQQLNTPGLYADTLVSMGGCDSISLLELQVMAIPRSETEVRICAGEAYPFQGELLTAAGNYEALIPLPSGCDSLASLTLLISPASESLVRSTACETYFWPAAQVWFSESGTYQHLLTNAAGCDSLLTLELRIGQAYLVDTFVNSRTPYTWPADGRTYPRSGVYEAVFPSALGCDSLLVLHLTIPEAPSLYIPNAFSPNGDGINDGFTIYGSEDLLGIAELAVYDRWGNLLTRLSDFPPGEPGYGWDGTGRGRIMDPGVYVFTATLRLTDDRNWFVSGEVILIR
jgi:gliding motility-associated-like protein